MSKQPAVPTIYVVADSQSKESPRLIAANSRAQVARHIASRYEISPARPNVIGSLMTKGTKIEEAGKDDEADQAAARG